ncbi:hypothetical protein NEOLEDRAFT_1130726 [Neolentinus lepideus HHB14362 ss-1]|uniref:Ribosomal protein L10 n=1 Tax=Neolentinus lepideus HHB14362 ss-1 TaxID=1314782 RepID=A0A165U5A4_9AGAM|nr:hypothetical protein NEOLEDRAFT_1130726 [Neolentinus lepideus HHB14362 ss-1]
MLPPHASRLASTSAQRLQARTYAISVKPPVKYLGKPEPRVYGTKKSFLYNHYIRILQSSTNSPLIFLEHKDFSVPRLIQLRKEIANASDRATKSQMAMSPVPIAPEVTEPPSLKVMRTTIFGVALRDYAPLDKAVTEQIASMVKGGFAILSLPTLNPPQLNAILRALDRTVPPKKPLSKEEIAQKKAEADADPVTPGRRPKRQRPTMTPELKVVGALIEGRVLTSPAVQDVSKLPTLDTLRAQIVGLLSSPATQLAAVLSEASGGKLHRTLEGFKRSLEEGQSAAVPPP